MDFLKNELMCITKSQLFNHDCLPILMLLYIMLYILLAYLMLFAALSNAICIMLLFLFFFCHIFLQMLFILMLCLGLLTHSLSNSCIICIMHSAFNLLVFPNCMFF